MPELPGGSGVQRVHRAHRAAHRVGRPNLNESCAACCSGPPTIFGPPRRGRVVHWLPGSTKRPRGAYSA